MKAKIIAISLFVMIFLVNVAIAQEKTDMEIIKEAFQPIVDKVKLVLQYLYLDQVIDFIVEYKYIVLAVCAVLVLIITAHRHRVKTSLAIMGSVSGAGAMFNKQYEEVQLNKQLEYLKRQNKMREKTVKEREKQLGKMKKTPEKYEVKERLAKEKSLLSILSKPKTGISDAERKKQRLEQGKKITEKICKDDLVDVVKEHGEIEINDLSDMISVDKETVKSWINELKGERKINVSHKADKVFVFSVEKGFAKEEEKPAKPIDKLSLTELIKIVEMKKKMSIDEVTKKLNVSKDVIEKYVDFLKKSGYLKVVKRKNKTFFIGMKKIANKKKLKEKIIKQEERKRKLKEIIMPEEKKVLQPEAPKKEKVVDIKKRYPKLPEDPAKRTELEILIAKKICRDDNRFKVSQVIRNIEDLYAGELDRDNRIEIHDEIRKWISTRELCVEDIRESGIQFYKFIS